MAELGAALRTTPSERERCKQLALEVSAAALETFDALDRDYFTQADAMRSAEAYEKALELVRLMAKAAKRRIGD